MKKANRPSFLMIYAMACDIIGKETFTILGNLLCVINLVVALGNVIFMTTAEPTTGYVADVQVREWHSTTSTRNGSTHHDVTMTQSR